MRVCVGGCVRCALSISSFSTPTAAHARAANHAGCISPSCSHRVLSDRLLLCVRSLNPSRARSLLVALIRGLSNNTSNGPLNTRPPHPTPLTRPPSRLRPRLTALPLSPPARAWASRAGGANGNGPVHPAAGAPAPTSGVTRQDRDRDRDRDRPLDGPGTAASSSSEPRALHALAVAAAAARQERPLRGDAGASPARALAVSGVRGDWHA